MDKISGLKCYDGFVYDRRSHRRIFSACGTSEFAEEVAAIRGRARADNTDLNTVAALLKRFVSSAEFAALDRTAQVSHTRVLQWLLPHCIVPLETTGPTLKRALRRRARNFRGARFTARVMATLNGALDWAVANGQLPRNPFRSQ